MAKKCEFCSDYTKKVPEMDSHPSAWFSLYEHYIEVVDDRPNGRYISFKIKHCPMCGRKLE